jgi:transposase-like protein
VSVRRVEDITEALWGTRVSSGTVSRLNQKIYRHIEAWRNRAITGEFPYVYLEGVVLKRSWGGEVKNILVLIAIGVGTDGFRQILGVAEGEKEDLEGWRGFLCHLKDRGLKGVRLIISDACRGLVEAITEVFPNTNWQRCVVHFYRNVFSHAPNGKVAEVARMMKAIHTQESRRAAQSKATEVVARLKEMKLRTAAELVEQKVGETMTYYAYPSTHWRQLRTNNPLERIIREIRRRTRVSAGICVKSPTWVSMQARDQCSVRQ